MLNSFGVPIAIKTVYDVANRETFDALPRWYRELETYVSDSVVKIVVGNKLDKVRLASLQGRLFLLILAQEFSRQVKTEEGKAFAERMGSLFVEASAKTAVGVEEAFTEVVTRILETPELWSPVSNVTPDRNAVLKDRNTMPGNIDLNADSSADDSAGCSC